MAASARASRPALSTLTWAGLGALAEAGYLVWALRWPAGSAYGDRLAVYLSLFLPAIAAVLLLRGRAPAPGDWRWMLALAALFRLTLLPTAPTLSDDIYRYLWDGKVQTHGFNPYSHSPSDPALAPLRDERHALINHPNLTTIYPPLAQMLFAAVASVSPEVVAMKGLVVLAEMGGWYALVQIWRLNGLPFAGLLLYLWNPLVIVEGSGSGHNDALGVSLLLCAGLLIILRRPGLSIAALSGSVGAKLFPILALPIWLKAVPRRYWVVPPLLWLALWGPYAGAGKRLWAGLGAYAYHWEANTLLFHSLREVLERLDLKPILDERWGQLWVWLGRPELVGSIWPYTEPRQLAKLIVVLGLTLTLASWVRRGSNPAWAAFRTLGMALLWAPTLYPWYLQWILPFAAWFGARSWWVLSATMFLYYAPPDWGGMGEGARLWLQYAPFLAAWAGEEILRLRKPARANSPAQPITHL